MLRIKELKMAKKVKENTNEVPKSQTGKKVTEKKKTEKKPRTTKKSKATEVKATVVLPESKESLRELLEKPDMREAIDKLSKLGQKEVEDSIRHIELLDIRLKDAMKQYSPDVKEQANELVLLKDTLAQVDPYRHEKGAWYSDIPVIGKFLRPSVKKVLQGIASNYMTVRDQIDEIKDNIENRLDSIEMDNIQLQNLHEHLMKDTLSLRETVNNGDFILSELEKKELESIEDELEKQNLGNMIHKVQRRLRNLQERIAVNNQSLVVINTIIKDNDLVSEELKNTSTIATQVMSIGLTQQMALEKQKENIEGIKSLRDFSNKTLSKNADTLAQNTDEISSLYNSSILDLDEMKENFSKIMKSIEKCENVQKEGYNKMKEQIAQLEKMNNNYGDKIQLLEHTNNGIKQLEIKE